MICLHCRRIQCPQELNIKERVKNNCEETVHMDGRRWWWRDIADLLTLSCPPWLAKKYYFNGVGPLCRPEWLAPKRCCQFFPSRINTAQLTQISRRHEETFGILGCVDPIVASQMAGSKSLHRDGMRSVICKISEPSLEDARRSGWTSSGS